MSDPLSILANATAIVQLAKFAYDFAEAIHRFVELKPDRELNDLASEIRNIGSVCKVLQLEFGESSTMHNLMDRTLSTCFVNTLADCRKTMGQLQDIVGGIKDRQSSWDRTVRFLRRRDAISDIRKKIHSHVLALQLVLQTLNMYSSIDSAMLIVSLLTLLRNISYIAPQIANETLKTGIDDLRFLIAKQEKAMAALQISSGPVAVAVADEPSTQELIRCARDVVTSGETLYAESVAARSTVAGSVCEEAIKASVARVTPWLTGQTRKRSLNYSTIEDPEQPPRKRSPSNSRVGASQQSSLSAHADSDTSLTDPSTNSLQRCNLERKDGRSAGKPTHEQKDDIILRDDVNVGLMQTPQTSSPEACLREEYAVAMSKFRASLQFIQRLPMELRPVIEVVWIPPAAEPIVQNEHASSPPKPSSAGHRESGPAQGSWSSATQAYDRGRWLKTLRISPTNKLQNAVARGHINEALDLIRSRNGSPDRPDEQGLSSLHLAALFGETNLVSLLVLNGSDINAKYHPQEANEYFDQGASPILLAVAARKFEVVKELLNYGASYTDRSGRCNLPLWLLHARWLTLTDCQNPKEIIDMLQLLQTLPNVGVNERLSSGNFLLHRALRTAGYFTRPGIAFWFEIVEYLLDAGAHRDSLSPFGAKPLHIACGYHNETDIVELLLDKSKKDVNDECGNDRPLKLALKNQNAISKVRLDMARLLLESGASVSRVDREGRDAWSLIHTMTREGRNDHQAALLFLLEQHGNEPAERNDSS